MQKKFWIVAVLIIFAACNTDRASENERSADAVTAAAGQQLYSTYCAGCHGTDLQGASATTLLKDDWTYGRTRGLMIRNVKFGIPGTDMGSFEQILSDDQIRSVVDYVRNSQDSPPDREVLLPGEIQTADYRIVVEELQTDGLEVPWAIEFVDNRRALVSERKGQLRWLIDGILDPRPIAGTPPTYLAASTAGYMDIALDPDYEENGWVYLGYSHSEGRYEERDIPVTTKIIRGKIRDHQWVEEQTLFEAPDSLWVTGGNRWGCRLLFDDAGKLLFTIGDMAQAMASQDPGQVPGKVFRINPDGSIPADNPFVKQPNALGAVFSLGNRNVQGLSIHPQTRRIWASEHGPMGGDELNILKKGANYGWPVITYGRDYSGEIVSTKTAQEGMEQPVHQWTPSIGVCPIEFVTSAQFPKWQHNLLVGALAFEELIRFEIRDGQVIGTEMLLKGSGRVRDIKIAPDGSIYVLLNGPDRIIRLRNREMS